MKLASKDFSYTLPSERIALKPAEQRDQSKLLVYQHKNITHHLFKDITGLLPSRSTLFFNDTKVIPARLFFHKQTGGKIEIMLLNPVDAQGPIQETMHSLGPVVWQCAIKNIKKWKQEDELHIRREGFCLTARLLDKQRGHVELSWHPEAYMLSQVIAMVGHTPLPPYLGGRPTDAQDKERYQTVYCRHEGAVAAPTAGLHFSSSLMNEMRSQGIATEFVTLHVGGGTFQPIRTNNVFEHTMHAEQFIVTKHAIDTLLMPDRLVIAVGTTSMRVLESLYWLGVGLLKGQPLQHAVIDQMAPYGVYSKPWPRAREALEALRMALSPLDAITGKTSILILPGYSFQICNGLITNFHLPESTLIPLVAAFIGEEWKNVYQTALQHKYRFLSYGDSSLLLP